MKEYERLFWVTFRKALLLMIEAIDKLLEVDHKDRTMTDEDDTTYSIGEWLSNA